jgi:hypothetical protein
MPRRKVRDIYGNWSWEEDDNSAPPPTSERLDSKAGDENLLQPASGNDEKIKLEWRDWIALTIASLETILLPIVIVVVVLVIFAVLVR